MRLLTSAVEKLPDISGLIKRVHDFFKHAQAKSFQDQKKKKKNLLKMKSSIILISVKIINLFHKMNYKVVIGIINVVHCLLF